jgi:hypothetical protein
MYIARRSIPLSVSNRGNQRLTLGSTDGIAGLARAKQPGDEMVTLNDHHEKILRSRHTIHEQTASLHLRAETLCWQANIACSRSAQLCDNAKQIRFGYLLTQHWRTHMREQRKKADLIA